MSLYALKPRFQALLRPCAGALYRRGVTANQVTLATAAVSAGLGVLLACNAQYAALFALLPAWLLVRMALNAIDGMLAREHGQASVLGAYLNELTDPLSDAALYLPFAFVAGASPVAVGGVVLLAVLAEMAGVLGAVIGAGRRHDGPMGKSDRAVAFGVLGLLLGMGVAPGPWLAWALYAIAVLLVITIVNRVRSGVRERAGA